MTFSFILPAYKGRYLSESIDSILAQDYNNFELIIVDDCSPEPLEEIVKSYTDSRLTYYRNEQNIGGKNLVAQWNHCLEYATGDYVILATDDDIFEPNFLSSFVKLVEKYPNVAVLRSRIMDINAHGDILWFDRCYKEYLTQGEFFYYYLQGMKGGIPQFIFKRDEFIKQGGFVSFPLAWGSDDATALKFSYNGIVNSQDMLVRFRWSDINISSSHNKTSCRKKVEARIQLCEWLKEQLNHVVFGENEIEQYCRNYVNGGVGVHLKKILLKEIITLDLINAISMIKEIRKRHVISDRDLLSLIYRMLKSKLK